MERQADFWSDAARPAPDSVIIDGVELRAGSRVKLCPREGRDLFDAMLAGRTARIEAFEQELEGKLLLAVTLDDDPGQDLGAGRFPAHRFFFSGDEVEPFFPGEGGAESRILIAGIGNIFLGDDGFGVAVAQRLAQRQLPEQVEVRDFGIRGLDLAYALQSGYRAAILVDALPRGEAPGTLYVVEASMDDAAQVGLDTHGMDPVKVLHLARRLGGQLPRVLVVGCEPEPLPPDLDPTAVFAELSRAVEAAIDPAVRLVESLLSDLLAGTEANDPTPERR